MAKASKAPQQGYKCAGGQDSPRSSKAVKGSLDRASKATEMETIVKGASKATTAQPLKRGGLKEDLAKLNQSFWKALLRCSRDTTSSGEQKQPGGNQEESE